jgi:putative CocE/NonD family hydrolase
MAMTAATVDHFETVWIPMSDGIRLAARMWRPSTAATHPVPAILEYIPYRRRDGNRERDQHNYSFLAAHGYAGIRLDMRGSGDSEGILRDEYLKQEQDDAVEAIAWIAAQPWCDGSVGMMGISWGGFNALQVAARRPPALKAIVTLCSTDDRYADDIHYMGGCQLTGNLEWRSTLFTLMGLAPDPMVVADRWRAMWLQRLEAVVPMVSVSLAHQRRDGYWKHGSVCEDIGAIRCAVLAVGGWADGYSNAIFRLLRDLKAPRAGIVGPWGSQVSQLRGAGTCDWVFDRDVALVGLLVEGHRDQDHARTDAARLCAGLDCARRAITPSAPGHWVGETSWPSAQIGAQRWYLNPTGLESTPASAAPLAIRSPLTIGAAGGEWCAYSLGGTRSRIADRPAPRRRVFARVR